MMYPDFHVYLRSISIAEAFDIGEQLAQTDLVYQVVFEKSRTPELPGETNGQDLAQRHH
jgi:hypothetical protein